MKLFNKITATPLLVVMMLVSQIALSAKTANWPQWRGPSGAGISFEKNLSAVWSPKQNIKWKAAIAGRGHSSPIVWGKRIFLTTAIEGPVVPGAKAVKHMNGEQEFLHPDSIGANRKHTFKVICLDSETGKMLWEQTAFEDTPYDNRHRKSSYAASTPATDGKHVYAFFGTEGLFAYDMKGKLAWKADLGKLATVGMGTGTSPILFRNLLIMKATQFPPLLPTTKWFSSPLAFPRRSRWPLNSVATATLLIRSRGSTQREQPTCLRRFSTATIFT